MKKFLIAIIFLIPIIVFVAIQGTSSVIQAWAPPVNAERIEIRDEFNKNIGNGKLVMPRYAYDGSDGVAYIYINVYPSIAFSDEIQYTVSEEENYRGECVMEKVDNSKYKITAKKSGDVLLRIFSATNDNAYKMLNVYITSEYINNLSIYSQNQEGSQKHEEGAELVFEYDMKLYAFANPIEAIGENVIFWKTENEDIALVDANGKITPMGVGRAKITATVKDKTNTEHFTFVFVNIYDNVIFKRLQVYLKRDFFEKLDEWEKEEYIFKNLVVENKERPIEYADVELVENDKDTYIYQVRGSQIVIELIDQDELIITSEYLSDIYLENGGYTLIVNYKDFNAKFSNNIAYYVSDNKILEIRNGLIIPKAKGVCHVYAKDIVTQKKTNSLKLEVKERPLSFQLNYTNMDNQKGIKQQRVWALNWLDGDKLKNTYNLGIDQATLYPKSANMELVWQVDDTNLAQIDQKGNITFKPESVGKMVTVTATVLVHNILTEMQRCYTFEMVSDPNAVNVYSKDQFIKAVGKGNLDMAAVLQSDLEMQKEKLEITNSIYGNGYMIKFAYDENSGQNDKALAVYGRDLSEKTTSLIFENFTIQCSDEFKNGQDKGNTIFIEDVPIPVIVRNIIARYAWNAIYLVDDKDVTVVGSILGNTGFAAIYFRYSYYFEDRPKDNITLKNIVFRETGCASLITAPRSIKTDISDVNYMPNIIIKGFIDSYNWKNLEEIDKMFRAFDASMFGDLAKIKTVIDNLMSELLTNILKDEQNSKIIYIDENEELWISMNMFTLGINPYIDSDSFILENKDIFELTPVYLPSYVINTLKFFGSKYELRNPCYCLIYKFDKENGPAIKPNDACPENEELFSRLRG